MELLSRPLTVLMLICVVMFAFGPAAPVQADLIINEILGDPNQDWDGDGESDYKSDEWIEVLNDGTVTENLSEYWLRDVTGEELHLQLSGILEPGQVMVFYGSDAMLWQQEQGQSSTGFSINNAGDTLELMRTVPDQIGIALVVVYTITISGHEAENDRSSGWDPDTGLWVMYDALNPYNGSLEPQGNGCQPTPGQPNVCVPLVPAQATTWDQLKSRYR